MQTPFTIETLELRTLLSAQSVTTFGTDGKGLLYASGLGVFHDALYFTGEVEGNWNLYRSDGTGKGTSLVKQLSRFTSVDERADSNNQFIVDGNIAFFVASNGAGGRAIWHTDGTARGTQMLVPPSTGINNIGTLALVGHTLYFAASKEARYNDDSQEMHLLWISDGTLKGTRQVRDLGDTILINSIVSLNDHAYFRTEQVLPLPEDNSLWVSDGTTKGTTVVEKLDFFSLDVFGERIYMGGAKLFVSDGTAKGTRTIQVPYSNSIEPIGGIGDNFYFTASHEGFSELYVTDGSAKGTKSVAGGVSPASAFKIFNGLLYAPSRGSVTDPTVYDPIHRHEKTLKRIADGSSPYFLAPAGSRLFFDDPKLWITDGTALGTAQVDSHSTNQVVKLGSRFFFLTVDVNSRSELWRLPAVGTISGKVFRDDDASGKQSSGESNLSGWRVYLDFDDDGICDKNEPSTRSDKNGRYSFTDVPVGKYVIRETLVGGATPTTAARYRIYLPPGGDLSRSFGNKTVALGKAPLHDLFSNKRAFPGREIDELSL